jgi:hypothetical protein
VEAITNPALDAVTSVVSGTLDALTLGGGGGSGLLVGVEVSGEDPIVAASGSLDFPAATIAAAADPDELFSASSYTDYSIALTTQTPEGTSESTVTGPALTSSLIDQVLGSTPDVLDVPDEPALQLPTISVPSILQPFGWHL